MDNKKSRFIQLSEYILVEYCYSEQNSTDFISTLDQPLNLLINENENGQKHVMFEDSFRISTNNTRDLSVVKGSEYHFTLLDIDVQVPFNDFDNNLTNTNDLEIQFVQPQLYVLEEIKYHMVTGFDFPKTDGIILKTSALDREGNDIILSQISWLKSDNNFEINTNPLIISDKIYDKYLTCKILSVSQLSDEFNLNSNDVDNIGYKITGNNLGFDNNTTIKFEFWEIAYIETTNSIYKNLFIQNYSVASLPKSDDFFALGANLKESDSGDYFEYFSTWNGEFIEDQLFKLNSIGNNYILIHEITTIEQIGNTFIQTNRFTDVQLNNFGQPNLFRPIIKNGNSAISYSLEYVMRFFNKTDNSQIIRKTAFTSTNVNKYGRYLNRIQLSTNNQTLNVYNKIIQGNKFEIPKIDNVIGTQIKQIPIFYENKNIVVQIGTDNVFKQGLAQIVIDPFDTVIKFNLSETSNNESLKLLKLDTSINYELVFFDNVNSEIIIKYDSISSTNLHLGEIYFNISKEYCTKILKSNNNKFYIITNTNNTKNRIYQGLWVKSESDIIKSNNSEIKTFLDDNNKNKIIKEKESKLDSIKKIIQSNNNNSTTSWKNITPLD